MVLKAGTRGGLVKDTDEEEVVRAIWAVG